MENCFSQSNYALKTISPNKMVDNVADMSLFNIEEFGNVFGKGNLDKLLQAYHKQKRSNLLMKLASAITQMFLSMTEMGTINNI